MIVTGLFVRVRVPEEIPLRIQGFSAGVQVLDTVFQVNTSTIQGFVMPYEESSGGGFIYPDIDEMTVTATNMKGEELDLTFITETGDLQVTLKGGPGAVIEWAFPMDSTAQQYADNPTSTTPGTGLGGGAGVLLPLLGAALIFMLVKRKK